MNAHLHSTDSWLWRVLFTPVGPRLVVGRRISLWGLIPRRASAGELIRKSDLPVSIRELITGVVKRTRLWRSEKADVARELIAHFADAIAQGAAAEDAAQAFGHVRQASKLIRRSKRRNRPLAWQVWHRGVQAMEFTVGLAIVVYAILIVRYYSGHPVISHDYAIDLVAMMPTVPEGQAAWPLYREALMALDRPIPLDVDWEHLPLNDEHWQWFEDNEGSIKPFLVKARVASAKPHLGVPFDFTKDMELERHLAAVERRDVAPQYPQVSGDHPPVMFLGIQSVFLLRQVSTLLIDDGRFAMMRHDGARFVDDVSAVARLANQARELPHYYDDIMSFDLLLSSIKLLEEASGRSLGWLTELELDAISQALAAYNGGEPARVRFESQRVYFKDLVQRLYTNDGEGSGRIAHGGVQYLRNLGQPFPYFWNADEADSFEWAKGPILSHVIAKRCEVLAEFDKQLEEIDRQAARPMWMWEEVPGAPFEALVRSDQYHERYYPLFITLPAVGLAAAQAEMATLRRDAMLAVIALELYRRDHGGYPNRLDQLIPSYLAAVPIDQFDGKPLRYRLTDEGPLLYSVGTDRIDDNGVSAKSEADQWNVIHYFWKVPTNPLHADWVLWDGRKHEGDTDAR